MLDVMSGGRMEYAFPLGTGMEYWSNEGTINPTTARARFRESLDIILKSWTEDGPMRYDGDFYTYRYLNVVAEAVPEAAPEVLHRRHGQRGDGARSRSTTTSATRSCSSRSRTSSARSRACASWRTSAGKTVDPDDLIIVVMAYVADTDEEAVREARPHIENFFSWFHRVTPRFLVPPGYVTTKEFLRRRLGRRDGARAPRRRWDDMVNIGRIACGSPDTVADTIVSWCEEAGAGRVNVVLENGDMPEWKIGEEHDDVRRGGHPADQGAARRSEGRARARDRGGEREWPEYQRGPLRHQRHRHRRLHGRRRATRSSSSTARGTATGFDALLPLAERFRLIVPHHPGFGASADDPSVDSVHDYVLHYLDLFDHLGLGRDLAGRALAWAAASPRRSRSSSRRACGGWCSRRRSACACPSIPTIDFFSIPDEEVPSYLVADMSLFAGTPMPPPPEFLADRYRESTSLARVAWHSPYDLKLPKWLHRVTAPTLVALGRGRPADPRRAGGGLGGADPERGGAGPPGCRTPALRRVAGGGRRDRGLRRSRGPGVASDDSQPGDGHREPTVDDDVPVLIAGGSLVGLSTALFLGWHGIPSLAVERHPGTAIHPRAALFNQRTIELYRRVGLQDAIVEASAEEFEQNGAIVSVESLGGRELEYYFRHINDGVEGLSPSPRLFITQIGLEPILVRRAEHLGAQIEWATELVSFAADDDGVTAVVKQRDSGAERTVRARYLVAADGSHSRVRELVGIPLQGHGSFSNSITIYFRADLTPLLRGRNLSVIYVFGPTQQGFFRFSKAGDAGFLVVNKAFDERGSLTSDLWGDTSDERCVQLVREALGAPELAVEIENVQRWNACAEWAERFGDGRVFLAGDAAHNMPPTGGFGGNVGVQDAHNLAWKLAYTLHGSAGAGLLATYDAERRPAAELAVEQAYTRYVLRLAPELGKENLQPIVPEATVELGYRYRSGAVVAGDETDSAGFEDPREPSAAPGTRAPHVLLDRDGERVSTIDLAGPGFVLLAGPKGKGWCDAARAAASDLGVGVDALGVGDGCDVGDVDGRFAATYRLGEDGSVLIRPDGFVAWRTTAEAPADAGLTLTRVLETVLARSAPAALSVTGQPGTAGSVD